MIYSLFTAALITLLWASISSYKENEPSLAIMFLTFLIINIIFLTAYSMDMYAQRQIKKALITYNAVEYKIVDKQTYLILKDDKYKEFYNLIDDANRR